MGKMFLLDTSGEYLKEGIKEGPFMVKPNHHELSQVIGQDISSKEDCIKALNYLREAGVNFPVITFEKRDVQLPYPMELPFFFVPFLCSACKGSKCSRLWRFIYCRLCCCLSRGKEPVDVIRLGMACGMAIPNFSKPGWFQGTGG